MAGCHLFCAVFLEMFPPSLFRKKYTIFKQLLKFLLSFCGIYSQKGAS